MEHEVKYVPENGSDSKLVPSPQIRRKILVVGGKSGHSLILSTFSLIIALVFFSLVYSWLRDVPTITRKNEEKIKNLEDILRDHSDKLIALQRNRESCKLPKEEGHCFSSMPRWYMKPETQDCHQFSYTGCGGNGNNFHTYAQCSDYCREATEPGKAGNEDIGVPDHDCNAEPTLGPCRAIIERFYYDSNDDECKTFTYGGCAGNTNNFLTRRNCEDACKSQSRKSTKVDICNQEKDIGRCRGAFPRWYFDFSSGTCQEFMYGGCDGNDNNFVSEAKCKERCQQGESKSKELETRQSICYLPADMGLCRAIFDRFFFNSITGKCESFIWGGCNGNENNFETIELCKETCQTFPLPKAAPLESSDEIPSFMYK